MFVLLPSLHGRLRISVMMGCCCLVLVYKDRIWGASGYFSQCSCYSFSFQIYIKKTICISVFVLQGVSLCMALFNPLLLFATELKASSEGWGGSVLTFLSSGLRPTLYIDCFLNDETTLYPLNKSHSLWYIIPFIYSWILFANIFIRIFASLFTRDVGLIFHS